MTTITVMNKKGEKVESAKLDEKIFGAKINKPLLQQVISMHLANKRTGTASTKGRDQVRGGGKKPWRQKGTGRARVGSIRSPLWRGGGTIFGPHTKDWSYQLPAKIKKKALAVSICAKFNEKNLVIIDKLEAETHKTKDLAALLKKMKLDNARLLIVVAQKNDNIKRAARNITKVDLAEVRDINAYQIIVSEKILMDQAALRQIEKSLSKVV